MDSDLDDVLHFATMQLLIGLAWWSASSIALYFALGSAGTSVLWYGGCLAALFNWYRFGRVLFASKYFLLNFFKGTRNAIFVGSVVIVGFTATYIGPEAMRVTEPTVGTCWAKAEVSGFNPVACWSNDAQLKTIELSQSEAGCPASTDYVFPPDENDNKFHCLQVV